MLILALDTTTRALSCAVTRGHVLVHERAGDPARSAAEQLPRLLSELLDEAGLAVADVEAHAVAAGPGSFTGLRVGIATMQGLAFAAHTPLVGISALDALAHVARALHPGLPVVTWMDAWRGEVYAARYDAGAPPEPVVTSPQAFLAAQPPGPACFVGDGACTYHALIRAERAATLADPCAPPLAVAVARLAATVLDSGARPEPAGIAPVYVRRPDAELARDGRPA